MKRVYLLSFLLLFLGGSLLAQNATNTKSDQLPAGFPVKQNTGNADADKMNYENAKKEWIKNNPEKYNEITGNQVTVGSNSSIQATTTVNPDAGKPVLISKAEFDKSGTDKQQFILAHPELYTITE